MLQVFNSFLLSKDVSFPCNTSFDGVWCSASWTRVPSQNTDARLFQQTVKLARMKLAARHKKKTLSDVGLTAFALPLSVMWRARMVVGSAVTHAVQSSRMDEVSSTKVVRISMSERGKGSRSGVAPY